LKTETIQNQYDGPHAPVKQLPSSIVNLDYASSDDAFEIDAGIRETIKGLRLSILVMGMGLAKLKAKGLYVDLKFRSMNDYLESLCDEMQVERSTAHNWLYIGEAFAKYRRDLERIKFTDADGPTKLPYVERAIKIYGRKEVFQKLKDVTLKEFKEYAKGETSAQPESKIRVVGNKLYVGEKLAVTFSDTLDSKTKAYLTKINVQAGEALEAGEVLYTTRLYDAGELKRFGQAAERLKKELRIEGKGKKS